MEKKKKKDLHFLIPADDFMQVVFQPDEVKGHPTLAYPLFRSDISPVIPHCGTVPLIPRTSSRSQDPQRPSAVKQTAAAERFKNPRFHEANFQRWKLLVVDLE